MAVDLKGNSKMANPMVKVHLGGIRILFCVTYICSFKIGKYLNINGDLCEGEFKDGSLNG